MELSGKRLILGSASPRRRELLEAMGISFTVDTRTSFVEQYDPATPHRDIPRRLAEGKSLGFHRPLEPDEILLTADTLVLQGDRILGKPRGEEQAKEMLRILSGAEHQVITAVCLRDGHQKMVSASDVAKVCFKPLSEEEIDEYVTRCRPLDKAGAYGIQEWIGYIGIPSITGSFYTIMGLPTHLVWQLLHSL